MYHDNVAVPKGDRGRLTWKFEYNKDYENLDKKSSAGVENDRKLWRARSGVTVVTTTVKRGLAATVSVTKPHGRDTTEK